MAEGMRKIVVAATPTSPLLSPLLHALSHQPHLTITVLTRQTNIKIPFTAPDSYSSHKDEKHNHHTHQSPITHVQTTFSLTELTPLLQSTHTLICFLTGIDIHLSAPLISAASTANIQHFIPSEFGLDTSNPSIRTLLPPYKTRFEIQELLRESGLRWTALYSGLVLEEEMKTDGVFGIDVLWGSVSVFPHRKDLKVAVSSYRDIVGNIVELVLRDIHGEAGNDGKVVENEIWTSGFRATLEEILEVVEKELDRKLDRYEGDFVGARKEAGERMKMGYFDGGVSLMSRVAVWDEGVDAWGAWKEEKEEGNSRDWREEVRRVARMVRSGDSGGKGCGC